MGRILEGAFGLIRERFAAVAVWTGIYLVGNLVILLATQQALAAATDSTVAGDPGAIGALAPVYALNLVLALVGLVLYTAAMRAVLRPEAGRMAYLRLGMDELRQLALLILFALIAVILWTIMGFGFGLLSVGVAVGTQSPLFSGLVMFVMGLLVLAVIVFLTIRFSLAFPLTLHRRQFVIGEAWTLSRGHFWTLFGAAFVISVIGLVLVLLVSSFALGSYFSDLMAAAGDPAATEVVAQAQMETAGQFSVMMVVQSIGGALVAGIWVALSGGSIATAARLLVDNEFEDAEDIFG
ncbi:hypothetical protein [Sphingomonas plantiphila]|uniref:hypothetical protein n=1 Tax=Sphingomonas plantiphila TaxID=3163295 RepID=UPI0038B48C15